MINSLDAADIRWVNLISESNLGTYTTLWGNAFGILQDYVFTEMSKKTDLCYKISCYKFKTVNEYLDHACKWH